MSSSHIYSAYDEELKYLMRRISEMGGLAEQMVGDSVRDIRAARAANTWPLLVRTGKGVRTVEQETERCDNVLVFEHLAAVATYLITPPE